MGILIQLAIYAALAGVLVFGVNKVWTGFKEKIAAPYVQAQIAADQEVVNSANAKQAAAEAERDHAKADSKECEVVSKKQNDAIGVWQTLALENAKNAKAAKEGAMKEATTNAPKIAELTAKAAAAPKLMACEEELGKARETLRDALRLRRGVPPPAQPPPVLVK